MVGRKVKLTATFRLILSAFVLVKYIQAVSDIYDNLWQNMFEMYMGLVQELQASQITIFANIWSHLMIDKLNRLKIKEPVTI